MPAGARHKIAESPTKADAANQAFIWKAAQGGGKIEKIERPTAWALGRNLFFFLPTESAACPISLLFNLLLAFTFASLSIYCASENEEQQGRERVRRRSSRFGKGKKRRKTTVRNHRKRSNLTII